MGICLHKAKRTSNGEWIEGYLYKLAETNHPFIMLQDKNGASYEVDETTVSRCLGLPCRNTECVWENDIVRTEFSDGEYICVVTYNTEKGCFMLEVPCENNYPYNIDAEELKHYDVIGNRFDNPELLEVLKTLDDGVYEVMREIDTKTAKGERLRIAYHTGIVIEGDKAVAAGKVWLETKDLQPVASYLKKVHMNETIVIGELQEMLLESDKEYERAIATGAHIVGM